MLDREMMAKTMYNERDYMPLDYKCDDPEKEELIKQLVAVISMDPMLQDPANICGEDPDFWMIDKLFSKEEVKFILSFGQRRVVKLTAEQLAERNNMSVEKARELAESCSRKGILEFDRENEAKERQYFIPVWVVGSGEYILMSKENTDKFPEIASFFNYLTQYV